jgi:hypothetical protein
MKFFLFGLAIGILFLFFCINLGVGSKIEQPTSFNHKKHLEQGTECIACHAYYKDETFSGMPKVAACLECHKDPLTQEPEEGKIRKWSSIYFFRLNGMGSGVSNLLRIFELRTP